MAFELLALPYEKMLWHRTFLKKHWNTTTVNTPHNTYVVNLNNLIPGTEFENKTLEGSSRPSAVVFSITQLKCGTTPFIGIHCHQMAVANQQAH